MCRLKANLANLADVHHNLSSVPLFALRPVMFHLLERVNNQTVEEVKLMSERVELLKNLKARCFDFVEDVMSRVLQSCLPGWFHLGIRFDHIELV